MAPSIDELGGFILCSSKYVCLCGCGQDSRTHSFLKPISDAFCYCVQKLEHLTIAIAELVCTSVTSLFNPVLAYSKY